MSTPAHHHDDDDDNVIVFPTPTPIDTGDGPGPVAAEEDTAASTTALDIRPPMGVVVGGRRITTLDHPLVKRAGRAARPVAGAAWLTARGLTSWAGQAWSNLRFGAVREQIRAAKTLGDREALAEWTERLNMLQNERAARLRELPGIVGGLTRLTAIGVGVGAGMTVAGGVYVAVDEGGMTWGDWWSGVAGVIETTGEVLRAVALYSPWAAVPAVMAAAYLEGRRRCETPSWVNPTVIGEAPERQVVPDEGAILGALRHLGIPALDKAFKAGWTPRWVQGTGRDGRGYRTQLELPRGVTVEMVNNRKGVLAHNLVRLPVEVWPTEPKKLPGVLDLWVADQGVLSGPVDEWPLLRDGECDYFKGVPVGIDQRGEQVTGRLMACNYAIGGTMGSGKTSLVLNLLLGACLDPLVEIDVYVMAFNVDYDPLKPRLRTLVKGDEDAQIEAAIEGLRDLRSEVTRRGQVMEAMGGEETKLTRAIAEADPSMRPRVVVFDECQELFRHDEYGKEAKELAIKVMMKARKCGITLLFVTPAPSADSLPRDLAKTATHRVAFAIADHQGSDAILGTGMHRQGITATTLVPGEDVGTAMAAGFSKTPGLLRCHFVRKEKGHDEITPIVERAMALRDGITTMPTACDTALTRVDHLADIATVLQGHDRLRTQEVLHALVNLDPATYSSWTFTDLTDALPEGAKPYKSHGSKKVSRHRVLEAITERDSENDPTEDDA